MATSSKLMPLRSWSEKRKSCHTFGGCLLLVEVVSLRTTNFLLSTSCDFFILFLDLIKLELLGRRAFASSAVVWSLGAIA